MRLRTSIAALGAAFAVCGGADAAALERITARSPVIVVAAGDIASCDSDGDSATAALVARIAPAAVLTLGDNAYPAGSDSDYAACYDPTWGAFRARTFPSPGNHEYATPRAAGYFRYFGARARAPYYSFNVGAWHVVSLNSEIPHGTRSAQVRWLRRDLRADRHRCELVYAHRPRFSGGTHGSDRGMHALWRAAYDHGVDLFLAGHDHNYQRFRKLDRGGRRDPARGIRMMVVGTGGKSHYPVGTIANRQAANGTTWGVLRLGLRRGAYDLRFVPVAGETWTDVLRDQRCH